MVKIRFHILLLFVYLHRGSACYLEQNHFGGVTKAPRLTAVRMHTHLMRNGSADAKKAANEAFAGLGRLSFPFSAEPSPVASEALVTPQSKPASPTRQRTGSNVGYCANEFALNGRQSSGGEDNAKESSSFSRLVDWLEDEWAGDINGWRPWQQHRR